MINSITQGEATMKMFSARAVWLGCGMAAVLSFVGTPIVSGQTVQAFTGTTSDFWTASTNWTPSGVPNSSTSWAQIDSRSTTGSPQKIFYPSSSLTANTMAVGAISFLPTLALSSGTALSVQNNSSSIKGTLAFYGIDTTIGGTPRRIILDNSSALDSVSFTQTLAGQEFQLNTSGVVNVAANTQLTLSPKITEVASPRTITKIGSGILSFSGTNQESSLSTYSGGFVLEDGIVQWASSGTAGSGTAFGLGPLTLQGGTLRSTTTSGRSINVDIVLDGGVTLGSIADGFTGNITINSNSGALTTTIASDSVVTIPNGNLTIWNQATSGPGGLTKEGAGTLRFSGTGGNLTYSGNTIVQAGTLDLVGDMLGAGTLEVRSGGTFMGTSLITGATTILAGGTLSPGASPGVLSFGDNLTLAGTTVMEIAGSTRETDYDGIDVVGTLAYGGALDLQIPNILSNGTYDLFNGYASQTGTFASITLTGAYTGSLTESSGVWTGSLGGQDITFTNATGDLSVVPEPSVLGLAGVVAAIAAARLRWRGQGDR